MPSNALRRARGALFSLEGGAGGCGSPTRPAWLFAAVFGNDDRALRALFVTAIAALARALRARALPWALTAAPKGAGGQLLAKVFKIVPGERPRGGGPGEGGGLGFLVYEIWETPEKILGNPRELNRVTLSNLKKLFSLAPYMAQ